MKPNEDRKRRPSRLVVERNATDAALWHALLAQPSARKRIWNHVLEDEAKAGHETIEAALAAYLEKS